MPHGLPIHPEYHPMKTKIKKTSLPVLVTLVICVSSGWAANEQSVPLSEFGQKLEAQYASTLAELQAEIVAVLPGVSAQKIAAFEKASQDVKAAEAEANAALQNLSKVATAKALVGHAKGKWIGGAEKGIAAAQTALQKATTDAEREAAQNELVKWQENKEDGLKALREREEAYEKASVEEPGWRKAHEAAQQDLARAQTSERNAADTILADLAPILGSDSLDPKLAKCMVLTVATPRGLAEFAQQSPSKAELVRNLLADGSLMKEMLVAGGGQVRGVRAGDRDLYRNPKGQPESVRGNPSAFGPGDQSGTRPPDHAVQRRRPDGGPGHRRSGETLPPL